MGKQIESQTRIEKILAYFTHKIIAKYKPVVIGITGSVGKTSTRHAIAAALSSKYQLREPEKNYNNTIGIPLTVIGAKGIDESTTWFASQLGWLRIIAKALVVWLLPQTYPKLLVLEYGIDHPGDMDELLNLVQPNIAVLTSIGISHLENYESQEQLANEKGKIASRLKPNGLLVFNGDDILVTEQASKVNAHKISYGKTNNVEVILENISETLSLNAQTNLEIKTPTRKLAISIPAIGESHVSAVLCAVALCEALEVETDLIVKGLTHYRPMPGRLNILAGIKRTILIDDTYNSAPASTKKALSLLEQFPNQIKVAVLGDMLELGNDSQNAHEEIGKICADMFSRGRLSELVTIGNHAKDIANSAIQNGMPQEKVTSFENSDLAKNSVLARLQNESVVLVKGSQGARTEKVVKELLAEPMSATHMLVRQYGKWVN